MERKKMLVTESLVILDMDSLEPMAQDIQILPMEASCKIPVSKVIAGPHMLRVSKGIHKGRELIDI